MGKDMEMAGYGDTRETIVIVGGGICGLAVALALHRKGIKSLVLERSKTLRATGVAIVVHPNGWRALDHLGVGSYLRQTAIPVLSGQLTSLDNDKVDELPIGKEELRCVKRMDMINILAHNLPPNTVCFGCDVLSIELDPITSSPVLQLQDGTTLKAKAVIGCDGVNSTITNLIGLKATNVFNVCAVRGTTTYPSAHKFGSDFKLIKTGDGLFGIIPMSTNRLYWFITARYISQDSKICRSQKLILNYAIEWVKDFPISIKEMVKNCSLESLHFSEYLRYQAPWDILRTNFRVGKVTIAGDALHAMTPFIAQGGSASLEDAVVLARCLARKTAVGDISGRGRKVMVEEAFDEYLNERKPRLLRLSSQSYLLGKMNETPSKFIKFLCIVFMVILFRESHSHTRYDCGSL